MKLKIRESSFPLSGQMCQICRDVLGKKKIERGEEGVEINRWKAYRDFTAYSASEVISGALDEWLDGSSNNVLSSAPEPLGSEVQTTDI